MPVLYPPQLLRGSSFDPRPRNPHSSNRARRDPVAQQVGRDHDDALSGQVRSGITELRFFTVLYTILWSPRGWGEGRIE